MRSVPVTLAVGLGLLAVVAAVTLTRAPPRVVRAVAVNERVGREEHVPLAQTDGDTTVCQSEAALPAGVTGIRVWLRSVFGASVRLTVSGASGVLARGSRAPTWTGQSVTVPVRPLAQASSAVRLCAAIGPNSEPVVLLGDFAPLGAGATITTSPPARAALTPGAARLSGGQMGGKVGVEYLAAGRSSWWSRASTVAQHMGLGRSYTGTWIALLVAALAVAVVVLTVRLAARELP
jgi:hypothetical protein